MLKTEIGIPKHRKKMVRITYIVALIVFTILTVIFVFIVQTKQIAFDTKQSEDNEITSFPIGVNPAQKLITENPEVDTYFNKYISSNTKEKTKISWINYITSKLALLDWYQNLASPISRILVIFPGERWEQVAKNFSKILYWSKDEKDTFVALVASSTPELSEGKFYPTNYVVDKDATPEYVANMIINRFETEVISKYSDDISKLVPIEDTLIIASLLEREANDFTNMRQISGIIWNRIFIDMNLQLDATLQYAKGSKPYEQSWWPKVQPSDKYIDSPYNTYKNNGLPPAPISNPSSEAILAALNPKNTECIFYFHDENGEFHCSPTYKEHVELLKKHYGQGR